MWSKVRLTWYEHFQMATSIYNSCLLSFEMDTSFTNTNNPISACPSGRQSSSMVLSGSMCARHGLLNARLFPSCRRIPLHCSWQETNLFMHPAFGFEIFREISFPMIFFQKIKLERQYLKNFFKFYWRTVGYNIASISVVQQSDSVVHIFYYIFFSILVYHRYWI